MNLSVPYEAWMSPQKPVAFADGASDEEITRASRPRDNCSVIRKDPPREKYMSEGE